MFFADAEKRAMRQRAREERGAERRKKVVLHMVWEGRRAFRFWFFFLILKVPSNEWIGDMGTGGDSGKVSHDQWPEVAAVGWVGV